MPLDIGAIFGGGPLGGSPAAGSKEFGSSTASTTFGDVGRGAFTNAQPPETLPLVWIGAFVLVILAVLMIPKK